MILIAGATGQLGGMATRQLLERGHDVRILVREGSDHAALSAAGAAPVHGDLKDAASLRLACQGVDTVVTTANSAGRGGEDTVQSVEIAGNRNLIDAAAAAGVRHFIFVSALGAAEDSPVEFMRGKAAAERHLRESGMRYTILQPNIFIEAWAGMLVAMPVQSGQPVTLVGGASRQHAMISIGDVAAFIVACVGNDAALDRTIPLGGPAAVSWREVVAACEAALGRPLEVRHVEPGQPLPGLPDVVAQLAAAFETYDSPIPMDETARQFGVRLRTLEEYARDTFAG